MRELKKEELLKHLDWWRKVAHIGSTCKEGNICNQAYNQIVALIKKEVTEEWIEEKANELITMVANLYPREASPCVMPRNTAKDFIRSLVGELK